MMTTPSAGFFLSDKTPDPALWCGVCCLYYLLTNPDDLAEQREAKAAHRCNQSTDGWIR